MRVTSLPTLPQWRQGNNHWVLLKLPSWLSLPIWTAAQAAAIINDEDPENKSTETLEMLDGRSIPLATTNEIEKNYLRIFQHNKEAFMVHASAHNKDKASPEDWLIFAETIVGICPEWKQLAIDEGLLPIASATGAQAAHVKEKAKGGRPKTIEKKANAVRQIIELFEKTAGIKFESNDLPGSAADLLEACQRIERAKTNKFKAFDTTEGAFNKWLKSAGYGFSPGR